jgi:hypothetical protein
VPKPYASKSSALELARLDINAPLQEVFRKRWPSGARPTAATCRVASITGDITKGDYETFLAFYKQHHPFVASVILLSPGGDVDAALHIGRLLRKYLIKAVTSIRWSDGHTVLDATDRDGKTYNRCDGPWRLFSNKSDCACASACALIWFGAPYRDGTIGLHRPHIADPSFSKLPAAEAANVYRQALFNIARYLEAMEAPKSLIEKMISTSSGDIEWVDHSETLSIERSPSFAEWVDASCGTFPSREFDSLALKNFERTLSPREEPRLKALVEKLRDKERCEEYLISANRDRLPAP